MKTVCLTACPLLDPCDLTAAIALLQSGEPVAIPTETVYGLAADLFQPDAVRKIFSIKGRPADNPLIVHIACMKQMDQLVLNPNPILLKLAERFWPGPLTLIFPRQAQVPDIVCAHLSTVAIRMPSHVCARQIIEAVGSPLAAPSANRSGSPSPTCAQHVLDDFDGRIAAIVDGGECTFGIESTVVGVVQDRPMLLRPGAISRRQIEDVLHEKLTDPVSLGFAPSPGMKYRHYAPKARVILVKNQETLDKKRSSGLCYIPQSLDSSNLYWHLRKADQLGYGEMAIFIDARIDSDEALMNRLHRISEQVTL
jgi:L-threonylcarbamoyladenylate synthase